MCFGGNSKPQPTPAPAPAPPPPAPLADTQSPSDPRRQEDKQLFGSTTPDLRVDRSVTSGGATAGGAGIRMK